MSIGAASAPTIEGPYTDIGAPLVVSANGVIDASYFRDDDGKHYLTVKIDGNSVGVDWDEGTDSWVRTYYSTVSKEFWANQQLETSLWPGMDFIGGLDLAGELWERGALVDKVATSFTSSMTEHGGQESTILALNNTLYHWGAIVLPLGYTVHEVFNGGGNPYGTSYTSDHRVDGPDETTLIVARAQGARLARVDRRGGSRRRRHPRRRHRHRR